MARIAVIGGAGYVGLSYAVAFAELGHEVIALDVDEGKIASLTSGRPTIFEPGLEAMLHSGLASGALRFTTSYSVAVPAADFVFICVGTPSNEAGAADMRYINAAVRSVAQHAAGFSVVVNKSTMPVGSAEMVAHILAESAPPDASFAVASNPEFLREGSALHDIFHPDRIIVGCGDRRVAELLSDLYAPLNAPILVTDMRSAEMIKYASNAFLATRISFINEVARICEQLDADVTTVSRGMGMDHRIGDQFLHAGAGFGGSCFPKDVRALASMARAAGAGTTMLNAVMEINAGMRSHVVDLIRLRLGPLAGAEVAVLGLSFKPNTDDIRESPAVDVARQLLALGAGVRAADPAAACHAASVLPQLQLRGDAYSAAMGSDAVVLMTEWTEYRALDLNRLAGVMRGSLLVDARNVFDRHAAHSAGLDYAGIGRGRPSPAGEHSPASSLCNPAVPLPDPGTQHTGTARATQCTRGATRRNSGRRGRRDLPEG